MKLSEVYFDFARFCSQIFLEGGPKFWDLDYKIERTFDHDQPRELGGDLAVKKKKRNIYGKICDYWASRFLEKFPYIYKA